MKKSGMVAEFLWVDAEEAIHDSGFDWRADLGFFGGLFNVLLRPCSSVGWKGVELSAFYDFGSSNTRGREYHTTFAQSRS